MPKGKQTKTRRIFVSIPDGIWKIIERDFSAMGETDSEILRNMIISYLTVRGYFVNSKGYEDTAEIQSKVEVLEKMIVTLAEMLEQKGTLNYTQWENRLSEKITQDTEK
jgi:hypothetical protein